MSLSIETENLQCTLKHLAIPSLDSRPIFLLIERPAKIGLVLIVCGSSSLPSSDSDEKNTTDIHRKIICVLTVIVKQSSVFQVSGSYSAVFKLQR